MSVPEQLVLGGAPPVAEPAPVRTPTPEQRTATAAADPYVFVEAGAGTGKTGVLVERYCDAVEPAGSADAVLAFTFTEKAAGEMRARVRAELRRRAASAEDAGEAERAGTLRDLARAPGAWVTTIHGFCRRLLAAHPLPAGIDPGFRVLAQPEAELLAERAFENAFEELLETPDPARLALAGARSRAYLRDLVRGAHDELRSLGAEPRLEPLPDPDPLPALEELAQAAATALEECREARGAKADEYRERIAAAASLAESYRSASAPDVDGVLALRMDSKAAAFSGPAITAYNAALARVVERLAADLHETLAVLVELYARHYAELKAQRSGLDFEDLQLGALRLLRDSVPVREECRTRFGEILVDEFQDTNRVQVALIEALRGPQTRLFTVGDELQSIYGFRHADVEVFRAERERSRALPLSGNFRSTPDVLGAVNALGGALFGERFRPLFPGPGEQHDDAGAGPAVEVLCLPKEGWDADDVGLIADGELDAPAHRAAEATVLARRLAELATPASQGGAGVAPGEMVVLLRAFTHVTAYEEALERAGLRPLVVGGRGYWSQQQVADMRCLLAVIANPLDDEPLLGALSSPACAASPDALWLLRRAAGQGRHLWPVLERLGSAEGGEAVPDGADGEAEASAEDKESLRAAAVETERPREAAAAIPDDDRERLCEFAARVGELRRRAAILPLDSLVDETARVLGYDLAALMRERGRRRWVNVRKLMRLARSYEEAEGRDLAGFVGMLRSRASADEREPEAQTEIEGHDGVRVMTVHNAKGLEFGVVAVADLGRDLGAGGFPPAFRARAGEGDAVRIGIRIARAGAESLRLFELEELTREATLAESEEDRRLAYVAATRAERRLILSGSLDPEALRRCAEEAEPRPATPVLHRFLAGLGVGVDGARIALADDGPLRAGACLAADGAEATVRVPGAPPANGAATGEAEIAVRLVVPSPGFAAEEPARAPAAESAEPSLDKPSTLAAMAVDGQAGLAAAGQLSNAALELYGRCGYRFYAERVIGLPRIPPPGSGEGSADGTAFGSAVHALLEWSARNRWLEPPHERCARALARVGLVAGGEPIERAAAMVRGWLASPLFAELRAHRGKVLPEAPFLLDVGGAVVRGKLDLLATAPGKPPLVVDYKTNALGEVTPAELMAHYETQRDLYALAAWRALANGGGVEGDVVRTAFVFLERPDEPVIAEHPAERIAEVAKRLEALVEGIRGGRFEVTDSPHRELCADCPARPALCSHPQERTLAPAPPAGSS